VCSGTLGHRYGAREEREREREREREGGGGEKCAMTIETLLAMRDIDEDCFVQYRELVKFVSHSSFADTVAEI